MVGGGVGGGRRVAARPCGGGAGVPGRGGREDAGCFLAAAQPARLRVRGRRGPGPPAPRPLPPPHPLPHRGPRGSGPRPGAAPRDRPLWVGGALPRWGLAGYCWLGGGGRGRGPRRGGGPRRPDRIGLRGREAPKTEGNRFEERVWAAGGPAGTVPSGGRVQGGAEGSKLSDRLQVTAGPRARGPAWPCPARRAAAPPGPGQVGPKGPARRGSAGQRRRRSGRRWWRRGGERSGSERPSPRGGRQARPLPRGRRGAGVPAGRSWGPGSPLPPRVALRF